MVPQTDVLKSTAHFTDAQTVLINESFELELGPALSPPALENFSGPSLQIREGQKQCWP